MRGKTGLAIPMLAAMVAQAEQVEQRNTQPVAVYMDNDASVPEPLLAQARTLASGMFASIGVRIEWPAGTPSHSELIREHAIAVRLMAEAARESKFTVGAFTIPTEGVHIISRCCTTGWHGR